MNRDDRCGIVVVIVLAWRLTKIHLRPSVRWSVGRSGLINEYEQQQRYRCRI